MNYYKIAVDIIGIINNSPLPEKLNKAGYISEINKFKTIAKKFEIDGVLVYIKSLHGRTIFRRRFKGEKEVFDNVRLRKIPTKYVKSNQTYIFPLKYKEPNVKEEKILGHVVFYNKSGLLRDQYESLRDLIPFVTDYLIKCYRHIVKIAIENKQRQILNSISIENLPGTNITRIQQHLRLALNAYSAFFCILDNNTLMIDYFSLNFRGVVFNRHNKKFKISNNFLELCKNKNYFLSHLETSEELNKIFKRYHYKENITNFKYAIYVFRNDNYPIALWVFIYDESQLYFDSEYKNITTVVSEEMISFVPYLFQRKTNKMITNPIFKSRETRVKKENVFVLMPFTLEWSERIWKGIIHPTVEKLGLNVIRADDMFGNDIMEDIWQCILTSRIVIADITDRNPNVFYELGIAHTLGKDVILLTQRQEDIPFDLNRYRHIIYKDNLDGYKILEKGLTNSINDILKK